MSQYAAKIFILTCFALAIAATGSKNSASSQAAPIDVTQFVEVQRLTPGDLDTYGGVAYFNWVNNFVIRAYAAPFFLDWNTLTGAIIDSEEVGIGEYYFTELVSPDETLTAFDSATSVQLNSSGEDNEHESTTEVAEFAIAIAAGTIDWNADTIPIIQTLAGHTDEVPILALSWSPDSRYLASGSDDTTIRIWDIETGETLHVLEGHTDPVRFVSWSPDGSYIASGSTDGTVRIWSAETAESLIVLEGHAGSVEWLEWSPNGSQLASASNQEDGIRIWGLPSEASKANCSHSAR